MTQFKNKTALITGASEGIGRATALTFAKAGAHLILIARNEKRLKELQSELEPYPIKVRLFSVDLSQTKAVDQFFQTVEPFDFAVNNAGSEGVIKAIDELSLEEYNDVFNTNVRSLWQCLKYEIGHFKSQSKPGCIVNMASILGFNGIAGSSLYVASKHAVIGFTKAAAVEQISNNIRINCVSPGATDTPMIRRVTGDKNVQFVGVGTANRMAAPEEIAQAILWLCSPESSYIVGHNLVVDAGRTAGL